MAYGYLFNELLEVARRDQLFKKYDFDPDGNSRWQEVFKNPMDAYKAYDLSKTSVSITKNRYPGPWGDNEADAFRHAHWSYRMAKELGVNGAKSFSDAHERYTKGNFFRRTVMDLHNNQVGRQLYLQYGNTGASATDIVSGNIGRLITSPYDIP